METETKNSVVEAIVRLSNLVQDATVKLSKAEGLVNRKLKSFEFREAGSEVRGLLTRTNGSLKQIFRSQREGVRSLALLCGVDEKALPQFLLRKKAIPSFVDSVALSNAPSPGSTAPELAQTTVSGSKYVTPTRARRRKKVVSLLKIHRCILGGLGKCVASERAALLADLENVARASVRALASISVCVVFFSFLVSHPLLWSLSCSLSSAASAYVYAHGTRHTLLSLVVLISLLTTHAHAHALAQGTHTNSVYLVLTSYPSTYIYIHISQYIIQVRGMCTHTVHCEYGT